MIGDVVHRLMKTVSSRIDEDDYEIVLVNDYSSDNTAAKIEELATIHQNVRAISFSKNFGQQSAIMAGFSIAQGEIVVCLDDDGQTPPEDVFLLINKLDEDYDVVYAAYENKQHSAFRNFGSWVNEKMAETLIGKPKDISLSSFFAARSFVVNEAIKYKNPFPYIGGQFLRTTSRIANVSVEHRDRLAGSSGYSLKKLLSLWLNGFTAFSVKPLRVASILGIMFSAIGFLFSLFIVIRKIVLPDIAAGWTSTIALTLLIGGLILFVLGVIGEYVGRIYMSINDLPQYVIRKQVNCPQEELKRS